MGTFHPSVFSVLPSLEEWSVPVIPLRPRVVPGIDSKQHSACTMSTLADTPPCGFYDDVKGTASPPDQLLHQTICPTIHLRLLLATLDVVFEW